MDEVRMNARGYIYIIQMGDMDIYKVGKTANNDPTSRLASIQTGNPEDLRVVRFYSADMYGVAESKLHTRLRYYRKRGEWFSCGLGRIEQEVRELGTQFNVKSLKTETLDKSAKVTSAAKETLPREILNTPLVKVGSWFYTVSAVVSSIVVVWYFLLMSGAMVQSGIYIVWALVIVLTCFTYSVFADRFTVN